ncbi:MAG: hypothetical protein IJY82_05315 [Oscillospiraceae bacterium]|nr:hypothetical protein [Oscillospiraceae bacterium]
MDTGYQAKCEGVKKNYCVISHTHWDREWYMPFEQFRIRLVDLIDRLFDILAEYPDYIFHLDAQTVVLEDYLQVRPSKKELLKQYIQSGNIIIGPWYLQNDFFLTSGEATIRNLLEGKRITEEYGACSKVGYAPDQFGNISQLPAILNDFGITSFVFGRGFTCHEHPTTEFRWEGPDGSSLTAIHMRYWYNNAQRFSADPEKAKNLLDLCDTLLSPAANTPYLLLMNGVDHLDAQDDLPPILAGLQEVLGEDAVIRQFTLDEYVACVQSFIEANQIKLPEVKGELRMGGDFCVLQGTLSSRHYLKIENVRMQNILEQQIEPLYSMLELAGCKGIYSGDHLRYFWKELLKNHPHDSICGCSRDEVHAHMEDNYARLREATSMWLLRGLEEAGYRSASRTPNGEDYIIIAANTLSCPNEHLIETEIYFPASEERKAFRILDANDQDVPFTVLSDKIHNMDIWSPINLPGCITIHTYRIAFPSGKMAPYSFKSFRIVSADTFPAVSPVQEDLILENSSIRVQISDTGRIDLTDKVSGKVYADCLSWDDTADCQDAYVFGPAGDTPITSGKFIPAISITENNFLRKTISLTWNVELPAYFNFDTKVRSEELAPFNLTLSLSLAQNSKALEIGYTVDNHSKDHRVRLLVDTGADILRFADSPFDIICRKNEDNTDLRDKTYPNTSFVAIQDGQTGLALLTEGAHEYGQPNDRITTLTVLRATGVINLGSGAMFANSPENHSIRSVSGRIAILPYQGDCRSAGLPLESLRFRNPPLAAFVPEDRKKFSGGRPAVQDTAIAEFFYYPEKYTEVALPEAASILNLEGESVSVTALKQAEDGQGLVVRLYSYGTETANVTVTAPGTLYRSNMAEQTGELLGEGTATFPIRPAQIITLRIK